MYAMIRTLPSKEKLFLMFIYLFIFKHGLHYMANDQSVIVCFLFTCTSVLLYFTNKMCLLYCKVLLLNGVYLMFF